MASWLDVIEALYDGAWNARVQRFRSTCAFRGLPRADGPLATGLLELAGGHDDVRRLELALVRNFRKYAHGEAARTDSMWDWLALAQHRGLPTRLMDWTYSPLVALHFATADPATFDDDGVIWCVDFVKTNRRLPSRLRRLLDREGSDTLTVEMLDSFPTFQDFDRLSARPFVVFLEPPAMDRRILNQHALFSLMSSPVADLGDWLRERPELYRHVRVPANLKWEIRDKLDQANVNERVLFPGLDGLSRWLARYYRPTPAGRAVIPRSARESDRSAPRAVRARRPRRRSRQA